jgi:hypothetical protein
MSTTATLERPIVFSSPMVRAILDGRKTVTRRVVKPQPVFDGKLWRLHDAGWSERVTQVPVVPGHSLHTHCRFNPGYRLWVRERHWYRESDMMTAYEDGNLCCHPSSRLGAKKIISDEPLRDDWPNNAKCFGFVCKPSIFMPRWASRITLEVVSAGVARLHEITEAEAIREGIDQLSWQCTGDIFLSCDPEGGSTREPLRAWRWLWDRINGKKFPWASNPWVWRIEFRRIET